MARATARILSGEELKLFQSVAAWFNFLAMDRSDLSLSVKETMRKMASPRAKESTALTRVARYTIEYPNGLQIPMDCIGQ